MTLSYRIVGNGPPLLLIHGMGVTYSIWENLVPELSPYYKLIMVELLGHGSSPPAPDNIPYYAANAIAIEALRQELGIDRWDILAYSVGAWVAFAYTDCFPGSINNLVLLCPALLSRPASAGLRNLIWINHSIPQVSAWLLRGWPLLWLVRILGFSGQGHPYAVLWTREITAQPLTTLTRLLLELPGAGRAGFPLPPSPALFLWANRDVLIPHPSLPRPFHRTIPGSHSAPMLHPEVIASAVLEFACP